MADRLARYRQMRDFHVTPEPRGALSRNGARKKGRALRYYIQRHHATRLHYDFRLELEGTLKSWAVPKGPSLDPSVKRLAMQTEDHPLEYGEFEGTIPEKQYGAGDVLLWDQGEWIPEDDDPVQALRKGRLHFELRGVKLHGSWVLARTSSGDSRPAWLLMKRDDDEARPGEEEIVVARPESVKRAQKAARRPRSLERPAKETWIPEFVAPQLATLAAEPPRSGDWVYEIKYDGYRMLARLSGKEVTLHTRTGKDWTARLPHLAAALKKLGLQESLLDGEIVVPGEGGRSDFQALQNAFDAGNDSRIIYYVFDAPYLGGLDLRPLALRERKERLRKALEKRPSEVVLFSGDLTGDAEQVLKHACDLGLEGLIGKQADAVYSSGRSRAWIKLKCRRRQDFVIGGYTAPSGSRKGFGSLLVGFYDARGKLRFAGKVGTGFDERLLASLSRRLAALRRADSAFADPPREKGVTWVKPQLVAEVNYAEKTQEGLLRQASFVGLREDVAAKSVGDEKPVRLDEERPRSPDEERPRTLRVTHPDRKIWPSLGITKLDLVRYYEAVAEAFLPHVKDRPLTLVRCPDGAEAPCFYQRHSLMGASPGELKEVKRAGSKRGAYIYADSLEGVLSAVQNGAVEFHTWGASVPDIKRPDRITIDLDPGPGIEWPQLVHAARLTRTLLQGLKLESFLKTTGGKGLHVVAPLEPSLAWDEVKEFTRLIAAMLVRAEGALFVDKMSKERRERRIFVDYLRNSETASAVAAYSARARAEAAVSMPLSWDALGKEDLRTRFTVKNAPAHLRAQRRDPWSAYWTTRQRIAPEMFASLRE
ncbi:MAG: DNA ligase D [Betaproteobacteria bacterium]|nr:DNA ligase D [Betaproteobacteria bacterium]